MPAPLISNKPTDSNNEFLSGQKSAETMRMTFHPQTIDSDVSLQQAREEQQRLKKELMSLSFTIEEFVDRKTEMLNEYQSTLRQGRGYRKLKKNLEEEYKGYLFMLSSDYISKVDQECIKDKRRLLQLRKEVKQLKKQLSKPTTQDKIGQDTKLQRLQKECYELKIVLEKQKQSNEKKQEQLDKVKSMISQKHTDSNKMQTKIDKVEYECELIDVDPYDKQNTERHSKLQNLKGKLTRMRRVMEMNEKVREAEWSKKSKLHKQKQSRINQLEIQMIDYNDKLRRKGAELSRAQEESRVQSSAIKSFKKSKQRSISTFVQHQPATHDRQSMTSTHSKARIPDRVATEGNERGQLLARNRRLYTELQKNHYFDQVELGEEQRGSRIMTFGGQDEQQAQPVRLPGIIVRADKLKGYTTNHKPASRQTQGEGSFVREWPGGKDLRGRLNQSNYKELCNNLKRKSLLIEEDCEYELGDLIYNSRF